MTRFSVLALFVLPWMVTPAPAGDDKPSKQETMEYLLKKANTNNKTRFEKFAGEPDSTCEWTFSFDMKADRLLVKEVREVTKVIPGQWVKSIANFSVPLKYLDPDSLNVQRFFDVQWQVHFCTTGLEKHVKVQVFIDDQKPSELSAQAVGFIFTDEKTANAVGKAFQHLIRECGGKPSKKDKTAGFFEKDDGVKTPAPKGIAGETKKPDPKTARRKEMMDDLLKKASTNNKDKYRQDTTVSLDKKAGRLLVKIDTGELARYWDVLLEQLDPESVNVRGSTGSFTVEIVTAGRKNYAKFDCVYAAKELMHLNRTENVNTLFMAFNDEQTAKAVGKAFQDLIRECGGPNAIAGDTKKPDPKATRRELEAQILKAERDIEKTQENIRKSVADIQRFDAEIRRSEQAWTDAKTKLDKTLAAAGLILMGSNKSNAEKSKTSSERYLNELRDNHLRLRQALVRLRD
jgi:hypothetical protein